jgi:hypothetical protein
MADLDELKDFQKWKTACAKILGKPFPPESSDCGPETLERDSLVDLSKKSNWALACEEILDTEHSHVYLRRCYEELRRRGKSDGEIQEMRRFAWHSAGWLNFPMMVWDWCSLDEKDMERAIDWLLRDRQISKEEHGDMLSFLKAHA